MWELLEIKRFQGKAQRHAVACRLLKTLPPMRLQAICTLGFLAAPTGPWLIYALTCHVLGLRQVHATSRKLSKWPFRSTSGPASPFSLPLASGDTYSDQISFFCRDGGRDCFSFSALPLSVMIRVYKYLLHLCSDKIGLTPFVSIGFSQFCCSCQPLLDPKAIA